MNSMLVPAHGGPCRRLPLLGSRATQWANDVPSPERRCGRRRLEELVLEDHALVRAEPLVDCCNDSARRSCGRGCRPGGVVGAVREPQLEVARSGQVHDVDALEKMVDRLAANARVRMANAASM